MITVNIYKQGNFPVNSKKIKDAVVKTLSEQGIVSDCVVEVAIVNESKMDELNEKYYKDKIYEHPVFTFTESEGDSFVFPPDGKLYLGEIVISYPYVLQEAHEKDKLINHFPFNLSDHRPLN